MTNKVFGIGCSRTGTRSLSLAMEKFGYRSLHYPPAAPMLAGRFDILNDWGFANDITVSVFYRELDRYYPDSLFILTVRDSKTWLASCERNFPKEKMIAKWSGTAEDQIFRIMYRGLSYFERAPFLQAYTDHVNAVTEHFSGRDNLLVLPLEKSSREKKKILAGFLDRPAFAGDYPVSHVSSPVKHGLLTRLFRPRR